MKTTNFSYWLLLFFSNSSKIERTIMMMTIMMMLMIQYANCDVKAHKVQMSSSQVYKYIYRAEAKCLRPRPNLRGQGRGQSFETEAKAKILASRPLWLRGFNICSAYRSHHSTETAVLLVPYIML